MSSSAMDYAPNSQLESGQIRQVSGYSSSDSQNSLNNYQIQQPQYIQPHHEGSKYQEHQYNEPQYESQYNESQYNESQYNESQYQQAQHQESQYQPPQFEQAQYQQPQIPYQSQQQQSQQLSQPPQQQHNMSPQVSGINDDNLSPSSLAHLPGPPVPPFALENRSRSFLSPNSASSSVSDLHYRSSSVDRSQNTLSNSHHNYLHSRTRSVSSFRAASLTGQASQLAASSMFDLNQSYLTPHLGANASSALMPRIKTIELYRKNAKKSNDPVIQFQFSQYMLQTALLSGTATAASSASEVLSPSSSQDDLNFLSPEVMSPSSSLSQGQNSVGASANETPSVVNGRYTGLMQSGNRSVSLSAPEINNGFNSKPKRYVSSPLNNGLAGAGIAENSDTKIKAALLKEAIQNLKKLADKGFADAQYLLGDAYASGALGKPDAREAFGYFIMAAKHGHAESSYRVSLCLEEGWGTSKDIRRAHNFLRSSATKGHPGAMFRLGMSCYYGRLNLGHSDNNKLEGAKWLTRASDSANEIFARAPFELAKIYETGYKDLIIMDHQYSVQLYVRSADLHYIPAVAKLGQCYEIGLLGCPQDPALSIHYYTIAALAGDASSMLAMCAWYMVGAEPNLPQNEEEAFEWAKRAAILNWPKAQYAVAYFLENGIGTETDIYEAAGWYRKAAANGDEKAKKRLENQNFNNGATGAPTDKGKVKKKKSAKDKDCIIM